MEIEGKGYLLVGNCHGLNGIISADNKIFRDPKLQVR